MAETAAQKNTEIFEHMPVAKAVRTMAVPTIMGQLIVLLYSIADTFFVGRTNNPLMVAGASLVLPVFNICTALASISGVGGGAQVSRLLGEKDGEGARRVSSFSLWFAFFIGLSFALFMLVFMDPLMRLLGAKADVLAYAKVYAMCVIVLGGIPTVMANVMSNLLRSIGESKKAGAGIMLGGLLNIALDPLFMFVLFPKGMEIAGAGAATCVSNIISCIYFISVIRNIRDHQVIRLYAPGLLPKPKHLKKIFSIGTVSAIAGFLFDLDYMVIQRLMSEYGDIAVAAIGIVLKAERLPLNIGVGICQGMVPIIAYNYSAKNYKRMNDTVNYSRRLGIVCAIVSIVMYELCAPYIMRFFIAEAETVRLGTDFLRARSLATVLMFLSFFHVHLFNSYGQGREAFFLGVMRWLAFNIPMLFVLHHFFGMYGIVWSQLLADILTVTLSVIVYRNYLLKHHMRSQ